MRRVMLPPYRSLASCSPSRRPSSDATRCWRAADRAVPLRLNLSGEQARPQLAPEELRQGLRELVHVEGQTIAVEMRGRGGNLIASALADRGSGSRPINIGKTGRITVHEESEGC